MIVRLGRVRSKGHNSPMESATLQQAKRAMAAADFPQAESVLEHLVVGDPENIPAWLNLAAVKRQLERFEQAFDALRAVLRLDSRNFPALLMQASLLERLDRQTEAAEAYGIALAQAPLETSLDPVTLKALTHAREVNARHLTSMREFVRAQVAEVRADCGQAARRRLDAFIDTSLRLRRRYAQEPSDYWYPGLPVIEFYQRDEFPWIGEFEAATAAIQRELAEVLRADLESFNPYVHYPDHAPLDQWRELNHSPRWTSYNLYERGKPNVDRCQRAPLTAQAIAALPQPIIPGRSPCAMFSLLRPHTRIPAHSGVANFRLVVHLPLILPDDCGFRVGGEVREWQMGEAWVFDDTIEHEAWNDSDESRIICICDIWSPRLTEDERLAIACVVVASDEYRGVAPGQQI